MKTARMRCLGMLMLLLGLAGVLRAASVDVSAFGAQRPPDGIYDPKGWIFGTAKETLSRELISIRKNAGLDILVVVLEKTGKDRPQDLAEELANQWGYFGGRALILYVPESKEGPWIAVSGLIRNEISTPSLKLITDKAIQHSKREKTTHAAVLAAVKSLSDDLRFGASRSVRAVPSGPVGTGSIYKDLLFFLLRNLTKLIIAVVLVIVLCLLPLVVVLKFYKRAKRVLKPKTFPDVSWKPRFGAPHAGIVYTHSMRRNLYRSP